MGSFRRGIGNTRGKKIRCGKNINVTSVARLGVVSKC